MIELERSGSVHAYVSVLPSDDWLADIKSNTILKNEKLFSKENSLFSDVKIKIFSIVLFIVETYTLKCSLWFREKKISFANILKPNLLEKAQFRRPVKNYQVENCL
jgi:hypothetical protein